jgi:hypothetical protein
MKKIWMSLLLLLLQTTALCQTTPTSANNQLCTIYFASGLFSAREQAFNIAVATLLENTYHYRVLLPQRDGFEFTNLNEALTKSFPNEDIDRIQQLIIYYLDMGYFIPHSNVMTAVLDEDLDAGVLVEITFGNMLDKTVIGLRTDSRSPFGKTPEEGAHFFSVLQLDDFLYFDDVLENVQQAKNENTIIAKMIDKTIRASKACQKPLNMQPTNNIAKQIMAGANILFHDLDIKNLNSPESLQIIVQRYNENRKQLESIYPIMEKIQVSMLKQFKKLAAEKIPN